MKFDPQSNIVSTDEEAAPTAPLPIFAVDEPDQKQRGTVPVTLVIGVCLVLVGGLMWQMVGPGVTTSVAAVPSGPPVALEAVPELARPIRTAVEETAPKERENAQRASRASRASRAVTQTVARQEPSQNQLVSTGRLHYFRGRTYLDAGRIDEAVTELTEAVRLVPSHADAHYKLGLAYVGMRDRVGARQELALLQELDPSLASLLGNLVR